MSKKKGLSFPLFAALSALTGYAGYMANKREFSPETKSKYNDVIDKMKTVGNDVKRTYISLGDKDKFETSSKHLSASAQRVAKSAGEFAISAGKDMYESAKKNVKKAVASLQDSPKKSTAKKATKKATKTKASTAKKATKKTAKKTSK